MILQKKKEIQQKMKFLKKTAANNSGNKVWNFAKVKV